MRQRNEAAYGQVQSSKIEVQLYLVRGFVIGESDISVYAENLVHISVLLTPRGSIERGEYTRSLPGNSGTVKSFSVTNSESCSMKEAKSFCAFRKSSSLTAYSCQSGAMDGE